jgi:hypothetical protein
MKKTKIWAAVACLLVAVACLAGCGSGSGGSGGTSQSVFVGTWNATALADANAYPEDSSAISALPEGTMGLVVDAGGSGTLTINDSEYAFTWDEYESDADDGPDYAATVTSASDGGTLGLLYHFDDGDNTYYYAGDYIAVLERVD